MALDEDNSTEAAHDVIKIQPLLQKPSRMITVSFPFIVCFSYTTTFLKNAFVVSSAAFMLHRSAKAERRHTRTMMERCSSITLSWKVIVHVAQWI